jgi:DNA-binding beta-propeller fold protein YncE
MTIHSRPIVYTCGAGVAEAIQSLGRAEDVKFSPDEKSIAVAGFHRNQILLLDVEIIEPEGEVKIHIPRHTVLTCSDFRYPHGVTWMNGNTLIVANREGDIVVVNTPTAQRTNEDVVTIDALGKIKSQPGGVVQSPGSVTVKALGKNFHEILVCNNYSHHVSRHLVAVDRQFEVVGSSAFLAKGLSIPDGISCSTDGRWIAVSNHNDHSVFIYENGPDLSINSAPAGRLTGMDYPHGVRFATDGCAILLADAGAPYVYVFETTKSDWAGERAPATRFRVMDEETFQRGRHNPQEGGPKGIDLTSSNRVLAVCSEELPLTFFDLGVQFANARARQQVSPAAIHADNGSEMLPAFVRHYLASSTIAEADAREEAYRLRSELRAFRKPRKTRLTLIAEECGRIGRQATRLSNRLFGVPDHRAR